MFSAFLRENDLEGVAKNLHNDLQEITLRKFPELEEVFSELIKNGARKALLSGSGPTVFGIFDVKDIAAAKERLDKIFPAGKNWKVMAAETF